MVDQAALLRMNDWFQYAAVGTVLNKLSHETDDAGGTPRYWRLDPRPWFLK